MGQPFFVIDARPARETHITSRFGPWVAWRLFGRNSADQHGSSPVTAVGYLSPHYPTDWLTVAAAMQSLTSLPATTASGTTATVINNQVFMFRKHAALSIPAQVINININVGLQSSGAFGTAYLESVTVELVKISSTGTVTQLATATSSTSSTTTGQTYAVQNRLINMTISAALSIAATERLAFRITTTGKNVGGATTAHCVNADGGGATTPTNTSATTDIWMLME